MQHAIVKKRTDDGRCFCCYPFFPITADIEMSYRGDPVNAGGDHVPLKVLPSDALYSLQELKQSGYSAEELRHAGCEFQTLKSLFTHKQLKEAGFNADEFKKDGLSPKDLKKLEFSAEELRKAGFDFSSLKDSGFNLKQLRAAGFLASEFKRFGFSAAQLKEAGFTARELWTSMSTQKVPEIDSQYHQEVRELIDQRIHSGHIFGHSLSEFLGFFAPFGTKNSFWNRLKTSPMIRHIFVHDAEFVHGMSSKTLAEEAPSPAVCVGDVDSSINNCALICALMISIPSGLVTGSLNSEGLGTMMASGGYSALQTCTKAAIENSTFTESCNGNFEFAYSSLIVYIFASFYSNIFSLLVAVCYYMCRPAESYNIASRLTLLEAFTLEVRRSIREKRYPSELDKLPEEPFENPILEAEVFNKASFFALNEAEEQKNQVFLPFLYFLICSSFFTPFFNRNFTCGTKVRFILLLLLTLYISKMFQPFIHRSSCLKQHCPMLTILSRRRRPHFRSRNIHRFAGLHFFHVFCLQQVHHRILRF
jgi:hypothetical protein